MFGASLNSIIIFIAGLTLTFVTSYVLSFLLGRFFGRLVKMQPKFETIYRFIRRLLVAVVAAIGVMMATFAAFPEASSVIASLFVAAGFASIVVGLAAQSSLSNVISGILLSISQPVRIGDAVMLRNEFCFVEDIRLLHTVLRTWDNRRLLVPNSTLQSEVITNYSIEDPTMLVPIYVQVSYESDLEKAMQIMVDVARRHPDFLPADGLPKAVVMEFGESGAVLRLLTRAKDQPTAFNMARDLLKEIKKEFDRHGIEIPYPRRYVVVGRGVEEKLSRMADALEEILKLYRSSFSTARNAT
jgi:small-conductance mechanosensitive channel